MILLSLLAVYLIWGSTYLAIKWSVATMPALLMSGSRFFIAGVILFVVLRLLRRPLPSRKQWLHATLIGTLLMLGGTGLVCLAEKTVSSSLASIAITTVPIWTCLIAGLFGKWPSPIEWVAVLLGFVGILLLHNGEQLSGQAAGTLLLTIAPISWALGSVLSQKLDTPKGLMGAATQMIMGGLVSIVVGIFVVHEPLQFHFSLLSLASFGYLIVVGSLVGFSAFSYLLAHTRSSVATSYAFVNPIVAVLLGVIVNGEAITGRGVLAMIVVLVAVILVYTQRKESPV